MVGQVSGESVVEYNQNPLMSSAENFYFTIGEDFTSSRVLTEFDLEINNNCFPGKGTGSIYPLTIHDGDLMIGVSGVMYFEDLELYDKWIDEDEITMAVLLEDTDSNYFGVCLNRCRLSEITKPVPGKNTFLFESFAMQVLKDDDDKSIYFNFF